MKTVSSILAMAVLAFFLTSCGGKDTKTTDQKDSTKTENQTSENNDVKSGQRYGVEQGMIQYKMETMGMATDMKVYWKDFGSKSFTETSMMGIKSFVLSDGEFIYSWSDMTKTGTKAKAELNGAANINYNDMDEDMMKSYNMKEEGTETIQGKECKIFTMSYSGATTKTWVYKGMALKMESSAAGIKTKMEVVKLEEGTEAPAGVFEAPKDVKFQETSAKGK